MYQINFSNPIKVHFIGIGGISMSGLACVLLKEGFTVTGSDANASALTELLARRGAQIMIGQRAENIAPDTELVVYTAAIHPDNPEFEAAVRQQVPMLTRAQLLGELMRNYDTPIAVSGTHGKTTTTSMLSHMTIQAGLDPTISVGGILQSIGGNIRVGNSQTFITEACEYTNSFLSFFPKISIILNIDADHLDFFKDLDDIRNSFHEFAKLLPEDGTLVINAQIPDLAGFTADLSCKVITFGSDAGDYHAEHISYDAFGCGIFDAYKGDTLIGSFHLSVPGVHNITNALSAIAVCDCLGVSPEDMQKGLHSFTGTDRRFQKKGMFGNVTVVDDYAHHPTEIAATLRAAKTMPHGEIWCAFQPHTYTRTAALLDEFAEALSLADHIILADIYAAREKNTIGITSDALREKLEARGADAVYAGCFEKIEELLRASVKDGDLLITMGAGDIYKVGENLVKA